MDTCLELFFHASFKVIGPVVEHYLVCFSLRTIHLDEDIGISSGFWYVTCPNCHLIRNFLNKQESKINFKLIALLFEYHRQEN